MVKQTAAIRKWKYILTEPEAPSAELASNRLVTASLDMDKDFKIEDGVVKFNQII